MLGESVVLGRLAIGLVAHPAEVAGEARVGEPLDAHSVSDLDVLVRAFAEGYNDTCAFMTSAEGEIGGGRPVTWRSEGEEDKNRGMS